MVKQPNTRIANILGEKDTMLRQEKVKILAYLEASQKEGKSKQKVGNTAQKVGDAAQKVGNTAQKVGDAAQKVGDAAQKVGNTAQKVGDAAQKVGDAAQKVGNTAQKVGNAAQKVGNTAQKVGITAQKVGDAAQKVGDAAQKVGDAAQKVGNAFFSVVKRIVVGGNVLILNVLRRLKQINQSKGGLICLNQISQLQKKWVRLSFSSQTSRMKRLKLHFYRTVMMIPVSQKDKLSMTKPNG
jgi:hypothetical protein